MESSIELRASSTAIMASATAALLRSLTSAVDWAAVLLALDLDDLPLATAETAP